MPRRTNVLHYTIQGLLPKMNAKCSALSSANALKSAMKQKCAPAYIIISASSRLFPHFHLSEKVLGIWVPIQLCADLIKTHLSSENDLGRRSTPLLLPKPHHEMCVGCILKKKEVGNAASALFYMRGRRPRHHLSLCLWQCLFQ
jgi:hypothetical protein